MKQFGTDWRFCPECQCIQHRVVNDIATGSEIEWQKCNHDFRPNSPKAVLDNQATEAAELGMNPYKVRTYQSPQELERFLAAVDYNIMCNGPHANTIIEIGSFHGGTAKRMSDLWGPDKLICVDRCFDYWLAGELPNATLVQGNSTDPATIESVKSVLAGDPVDLLFIDGDHSYAGEIADYRAYEPFVRRGGIIALHDTHAIPDVGRVFNEIPGRVKVDIFSYQGIGFVVK